MENQPFYLDPANQAFVDSQVGGTPPQDETTAEYRKGLEDMQKHRPIPGVTVTSFIVPFEGGVKTYIFRPKAVKASEPLPAIVYLHGGGWKAGRSVFLTKAQMLDLILSLLQCP
jgi:acetyl esterase